MIETAIETNGLVKRFGNIVAVDDVSLRVAKGEIYAFLGLNGAGKTTTIRMLLGMIKPTHGQVRILREQVSHGGSNLWTSVGYLVETPHAYPELTVRENLEAMRRLRPGYKAQAVEDIIDLLGLRPYRDRRAGTLSHGNAQRLGLAKALMHHPELLILDEPANGLDPAGIVEIRELLHGLVRDKGVTVFMSSHILGEVARLADRIGIIHQGRLIQELEAGELEHNRRRRLVIHTRDNAATRRILMQSGFDAELTNAGAIQITDPIIIQRPDEIASFLVQAGHAPTMLIVEQEDLEDYFLRLVGVKEEKQA